jgi:hypothetical protein
MMSNADELMKELQVATRVAGLTTDADTAQQIRSYVIELEDQLRHCVAGAPDLPL